MLICTYIGICTVVLLNIFTAAGPYMMKTVYVIHSHSSTEKLPASRNTERFC